MKKLSVLTLLIFVGFMSSAQNANDENIKKTIDFESDAIHNRNMDALSGVWQHSPDVAYTYLSRQGYSTIRGWDSLRANVERSFKQNIQPPYTGRAKRENYKINTNGNMAWAEYDQIPPASNSADPFPAAPLHVYRMLVKDNDQWKTVSEIVTVPESYKENAASIEESMNTSGYNLMGQKKINEAIDVFKLNVKLFPNSWNTYDSLGEAYALAGDKKNAIENYEQSIKLNPKNDNGAQALTKLKQQ